MPVHADLGEPDQLSRRASEKLAEDYLDLTRPAAVRPLATLDVDTRLQWRDGLHGAVQADSPAHWHGGGTVTLSLSTTSIAFPAGCEPALRAVRDGARVIVAELTGLDADDGLVVLRRLFRVAVLVAL